MNNTVFVLEFQIFFLHRLHTEFTTFYLFFCCLSSYLSVNSFVATVNLNKYFLNSNFLNYNILLKINRFQFFSQLFLLPLLVLLSYSYYVVCFPLYQFIFKEFYLFILFYLSYRKKIVF